MAFARRCRQRAIPLFTFYGWWELKLRYCPVKVGLRYTDDLNPCSVRVANTLRKGNLLSCSFSRVDCINSKNEFQWSSDVWTSWWGQTMNVSSTYLNLFDGLSDVNRNAISSNYSLHMLANTGDSGEPIARSPTSWYISDPIPKYVVSILKVSMKVRSPDGDTEYFDIVAGVLQGDTLAPYLFIICLDYVLRTSIDKIRENGFELTKKRSRRYPEKTITDSDYADDIALLANTPNQAETLLHSLEWVAAGIGLHVNAHKTEYMCYNQTGDITTRDGASLEQVDKFTYLGSSVSSTEKDIDTWLTKTWTAVDRLSIIWKSDLTDKMKRSFFQAAVVLILLYGCTTWTLTKRLKKKLDGN